MQFKDDVQCFAVRFKDNCFTEALKLRKM